jgi:replicative DNA helicase
MLTSPHRNSESFDLEAEANLLGCLTIDGPQVFGEAVARGITEESFYDQRHQKVFAMMRALVVEGYAPEIQLVAMRLRAQNQLAEIGGYPFLVNVTTNTATTANARPYIARVAELARLRAFGRVSRQMDEDVKNYEGDGVEQLLDKAAQRIIEIAPRAHGDDWAAALTSARALIAKRIDPSKANQPDDDALSFGFQNMDTIFGPMRSGQMVVLAARPSVGKSSLARSVALHAVLRENHQVIFASLEVIGRTLALSMAQTISGVSVKAVGPETSTTTAKKLDGFLERLKTPKISVLAGSAVSLAAIQAQTAILKARGSPPRLVVVDYLQLMPDCAPGKGETRAGSVGRVSRALKAFALAQNCIVLVLSQLNRDSAKDQREPALYDLRESGDIEQDADKVILLHRPLENPLTGKTQLESASVQDVPSYYIEAIQAKGRDDGTGRVGLMFRRQITRFEEPAAK